ncbi:MAG: peptide chain release factor-like protein [Planctomycetota bacterium]
MPDRPPIDREQLLKEVRIFFFRAGGPGGQHRNKVETGVRIFHPPSGITVAATERRSQIQNRELAMDRLVKRLEQRRHRPKPRKATRPPRSAERERLDSKRRQGEKKRERRPPAPD